MTAPAQTLAVGESLQQQYAAKYTPIGVKGQQLFKPLNRTFFQIFGGIAVGKSRLVQTADRAIIINTDESPTTTPSVKAEIWPLVGEDGTTDKHGNPIRLSFKLVQDTVAGILMARRAKLKDAPITVIFDSLPSLVQLAIEHTAWTITNDAARRRTEGSFQEIPLEQITTFDVRGIYGGTLYDIAHGEIMRLINELRHAGLGVGVVTQYDRKLVKIGTNNKTGEDIEEERPVLALTEGMSGRMWKYLDVSVLLERRADTVLREVRTPGQVIKIKEKTVTSPEKVETIAELQDTAYVVSRKPELARFLKIRAGVPAEFKITDWSSLETIYNTSKGE